MKRYLRVLLAVLLCVLGQALAANDKTIVLGKAERWEGFQKKEGLVTRPGRGGFVDLILSDSEYPLTSSTDLLLHFNALPVKNETPYYAVREAKNGINDRYVKYGPGAGVFTGRGGVVLDPGPGALFAPGETWHDFSIEFWLYPASLNDGESVLAWRGFRRFERKLIPQSLECRIQGRSLVWVFDNVFAPSTEEPFRFEVRGIEKLIPRQWRHHLLRFDSEAGVIEYLVDGVPVGTRYSTISGKESSAQCHPIIGATEKSVLRIGERLMGFLDELRIGREFVKTPLLRRYAEAQGRAVSRVFDLGYSGTLVKRVEALLEKPLDAELNFYVRVSDTFNTFDQLKADWIPFLPGASFNGKIRGRYVQLMVEFFPDGRSEATPRLFEISIVYEPDLAPSSPADLRAVAGDGRVALSWKPVAEDDVRGYFVFYGEAPLNYLGRDALQGKSPVDVGNVTSFELSGLKNGKLYFFAVAAYDSSTPPHLSEFHDEKSARPSEVLK